MRTRSTPARTTRDLRLAVLLSVLVAVVWGGSVARAETSNPLSAKVIRYWTAVGSCETGSGGPPKWDWGSKHRPGEGTIFEGGLGFSATVWQSWVAELGLLKLYPHAFDAPPLVQMRVAEYGVRVHGARWGCSP